MNNAVRIPPMTANLSIACYKCYAEDTPEKPLQRCSRCRRVAYCGSECQKSDWQNHKTICKALYELERDSTAKAISLFSYADAVHEDVDLLNKLIEERAKNEASLCTLGLKRTMTVSERNLIGWEPRCAACGKTERIIRMAAPSHVNDNTPLPVIKPCPSCKLTFYCSDAHWNAIRKRHMEEEDKEGRDGLSQCQLQQEMRHDIAFANLCSAGTNFGPFHWAPERTKASWTPLRDTDWEKEYLPELAKAHSGTPEDVPSELLRAATEGLTLPMTILWVLEQMKGNDTSWTRQETLTIHVLGAAQFELIYASIFEEILHQLPEVKRLQLVFVGPAMAQVGSNEKIEMETCPDCKKRGRKRTQQHFEATYHEYAFKVKREYRRPDLAIAFNAGLAEEDVNPWNETIKFLVKQKIPSAFTAYSAHEAQAQVEALKRAKAKLKPNLGPARNKWASMLHKIEPNRISGFYSVNGWLAGGF